MTSPALLSPVTTQGQKGRLPALRTDQTHATVWTSDSRDALALATVSRPYLMRGLFMVSAPSGVVVAYFAACPSVDAAARAVAAYDLARDESRHVGQAPADLLALSEELARKADEEDARAASLTLADFKARAQTRAVIYRTRAHTARIAAALAMSAQHDAAARIESGPVGPDWTPARPAESFYAQHVDAAGTAGPFAFGDTEEAARAALARLLA